MIDGVKRASRESGLPVRLISIMSRIFGQDACWQELEAILACRDGIIALDLAGDELGYPGSEFLSHFARARDAGLRITVHAGEAAGPESIWQAISELGAERIGHGVKAIEDPKLMDFLADHAIGIKSSLISNIQTSTVRDLAHYPLKRFLDNGILATLNSDDLAVQGIDIGHEYCQAAPAAGLSMQDITRAQQNGLTIAFLSEAEKQALRAKVLSLPSRSCGEWQFLNSCSINSLLIGIFLSCKGFLSKCHLHSLFYSFTQKSIARWVFLCFCRIYEFSVGDEPPQVSNLNSVQQTIIDVLGERYRQIYS